MRMIVGKVKKAESKDGSQHPGGAEQTPSRGVVRHKD
jgi:hypothetical protein